ncbi:MAG: isoprenylcysteine carboxylmethyltransferase family protein [Verrucomicrobia subdivision 3 bacterium]|nr:isoprenylcysteine carboxylmethyltransferase family protein [Limisphaerales bacterium]
MPAETQFLNRAVVFASVLVYWGGVLVQARRVRRRIGKSPNLNPRGTKERLLWAGWMFVIIGWLAQAFLIGRLDVAGFRLVASLSNAIAQVIGLTVVALGYAGTLWCYAAMGDLWRIGIDHSKKVALVSSGPYRFVRHPIYSFQTVMLIGAFWLLPAGFSLALVLAHLICVRIKAADEEAYLLTTLGDEYRHYLASTGRLVPRVLPPATRP